MKRRVLLQVAGATAVWPIATARAQPSAAKPAEWIIPYSPGGPVDLNARKLAELVGRHLRRAIVIQNRPGANGSVGTAQVMRAAPDGLTFGVALTETLVTVSSLLKSPPYDARQDLAQVAMVTEGLPVLLANRESGLRTMGDLVQAAKSAPDSIAYGSWGIGSLGHLAMACVERAAGIKLVHASYKGVAPMTADMLGNAVQLSIGAVAAVQQYMDKGQVTALAVMGKQRSPFLPQVPTFTEQKFNEPYLRQSTRTTIFAPRGMATEVNDQWVAAIAASLKSPEYESFTKARGLQVAFSVAAEATRELSTEWTVTNDLIRSLGIPPA